MPTQAELARLRRCAIQEKHSPVAAYDVITRDGESPLQWLIDGRAPKMTGDPCDRYRLAQDGRTITDRVTGLTYDGIAFTRALFSRQPMPRPLNAAAVVDHRTGRRYSAAEVLHARLNNSGKGATHAEPVAPWRLPLIVRPRS